MATKMYKSTFSSNPDTNSSTSKTTVAWDLKWFDSKWEAIIDKSWSDVWSSVTKSSSTPNYKFANFGEESFNKLMTKYKTVDALESALNAKWYTAKLAWTVKPVTNISKTINTPWWQSVIKDATNNNLLNDLWASDWQSSLNKSIQAEQQKKLEWSAKLDVNWKPLMTRDDLLKKNSQTSMWKQSSEYDRLAVVNKALELWKIDDNNIWKVNKWLKVLWKKIDPITKKIVDLTASEKTLNANDQEYRDTQLWTVDEKKKVWEETAKKQTDLIKKANVEKEDRVNNRMNDLMWVMKSFQDKTSERYKEIDDTLAKQKQAAATSANIAAAVAGQWPWVTVWEQQSIAEDSARRAVSQIAAAETAATQNKSNLDLQLKQAWLEEWQVRDLVNNALNTFTDDEYKYFLQQVTDNWLSFKEAYDSINNFRSVNLRKWADETYNRILADSRYNEDKNKFDVWDINKKVSMVSEKIYSSTWSSYQDSQKIKDYISKNPNAELVDIVTYFINEWQSAVDDIQREQLLIQSAIPSEYQAWIKSLSPELRKYILANLK